MIFATTPVPHPPSRPRVRLGCLPTLLLGVLFVIAFEAVMCPWAFHLGGRFTPLTMWEGIGVLRGSNGSRDVMDLRIWLAARGFAGSSRSTRGRAAFTGTAIVATPQGTRQNYRVTGYLYDTWWDADGAPASFRIRTNQGVKPEQLWDISGAFRGPQLVLRGNAGHLFRPDGSIDPLGWQYNSTAERPRVDVTFDYGSKADFEALAKRLQEVNAARR